MAEQPTNLEMFDVLSSIRRLVSEERRTPVPRVEPPPPAPPLPMAAEPVARPLPAAPDAAAPVPRYSGLPQESRFVLTAALRVEDEPASEPETADAASTEHAWNRDAAADRAPVQGREADLSDSADLARRTASLEETIAELEAAVADIGAEFEPDGGEPHDLVAELFPAEADHAPGRDAAAGVDAPPRRGEFQGIMAGFDTMALPEERLDAPITGEALIPPAKPARAEGAVAPSSAPGGSPFGSLRAHAPAAAPVAAPEVARHVSLTDALARDEGPQGLVAAGASLAAASDIDSLIGAGDEAGDAAVAEDGAAPVDAALAETEGTAVPADALTAGDMAEDEATAEAEADGRPARLGRPQILRSVQTEPSLDLGGPAASPEAGEEDGTDLFDPLAGGDVDVDALRDMVAELVREELRGVLGERITRNLRALVRQEIRKVLTEPGEA